ncbi:MAG TPA: FlgD immunoglobulin-like domain containing protein [Verrucomicrobiae bacterium]|jgi:hypothetical protein
MKNIAWRFFVVVLAWSLFSTTARANVYATDIKFDGSRTLVTSNAGGNLNISYILNEQATRGVTITISTNAKVVQTISVASGANGTFRGTNLVRWNGDDTNGISVTPGPYTVSITAAATGYANWTQISRDTNDVGNYVYLPRGVAVDNNSNSLYYGRVFIGSAGTGPSSATTPGDSVTILKLNADGTFADDGPDGNGGFDGIFDDGNGDVPQKLRVGDDDRLYMMDTVDHGEVVAFDMALTTNQVVLTKDNYTANPFYLNQSIPNGNGWFSMDVTDTATTNGRVWLGQIDPGGAGVWNWHLIDGAVDTNDDVGTQAVAVGPNLTQAASGGLMVDSNFDIFVSQNLTTANATDAASMEFPMWSGEVLSNSATWTVGPGDPSFLGISDTTIDSRTNPKYVACAVGTNGVRILDALTGSTIVPNLDRTNQYFATSWDNVGNLYAVTGTAHTLRVFSPPGTNQATTIAAIQVGEAPPAPPSPIGIIFNKTTVTVTFGASAPNTVSNFALASSPTINGSYQIVTNATGSQLSQGFFGFTISTNGPKQFYEIFRKP